MGLQVEALSDKDIAKITGIYVHEYEGRLAKLPERLAECALIYAPFTRDVKPEDLLETSQTILVSVGYEPEAPNIVKFSFVHQPADLETFPYSFTLSWKNNKPDSVGFIIIHPRANPVAYGQQLMVVKFATQKGEAIKHPNLNHALAQLSKNNGINAVTIGHRPNQTYQFLLINELLSIVGH